MLHDVRNSLRVLAKSPVFVAVALVTLMLGIGVNTAKFSIVNGAVLRGLPFPDAHRVIHLENNNLKEGIDSMGMSWDDFVDLRSAQKSAEDMAVYQEGTFNLSGPGGDPERITGCRITHSGPAMLHVPPHLGRWFHADEGEPGAAPVVVLGYPVWQNRFGGDPAIVGTQVKETESGRRSLASARRIFAFRRNQTRGCRCATGRRTTSATTAIGKCSAGSNPASQSRPRAQKSQAS